MEDKSKKLEACKFSMNELVLCYEPDPIKARVLYDAKVLDTDVTKDERGKKVFEYYIHFQGWNKSWDRWVLENQILKANETNKTLQTKLYDKAIKQKKKSKSSKHGSGDEKDDKSVTSMGSGNSDDVKVTQLPMVSLDIPKVLAVRLEDDCYNIKRKKKLIHLPRKPTVNDIFNQYYSHCEKIVKKPEGREMSLKVIYEMVHGLNTYFNYFLFSLLLYNFEREQYHKLFPPELEKQMSECFSPTATPITPKFMCSSSIKFSDSSRSNSRASSFCEDGLSSPKSSRKHRSDGKSSSVDGTSTTKRKRNTSSCSASVDTKESPLVSIQRNVAVETEGKRHSRGSRLSKKIVPQEEGEEVFPKEGKAIKPTEILEENIIDMKRTTTRSKTYCHNEDEDHSENKEASTSKEARDVDEDSLNEKLGKKDVVKEQCISGDELEEDKETVEDTGEGNNHRLRRSVRSQKCANTVCENDEHETLPMGSTAKSLQETYKIPRKISNKSQSSLKECDGICDKSYMMYPQLSNGDTPADIYGLEHLLRLFVKLPVLLSSSNIDETKMVVILQYVSQFLEYLSKRTDLFVDSTIVYSESVV